MIARTNKFLGGASRGKRNSTRRKSTVIAFGKKQWYSRQILIAIVLVTEMSSAIFAIRQRVLLNRNSFLPLGKGGTSAPKKSKPYIETLPPTTAPVPFPSYSPGPTTSLTPTLSLEPTTSQAPTKTPIPSSSSSPSASPTISLPPSASVAPSTTPTNSLVPSSSPFPTLHPSIPPTTSNKPTVTFAPSYHPSTSLSDIPSSLPSQQPTISTRPSAFPSVSPTYTVGPSEYPSIKPTRSVDPSFQPSVIPSVERSIVPSNTPNDAPTGEPNDTISVAPTGPTGPTFMSPSISPSTKPSSDDTIDVSQTAVFCDGVILERKETFWFKYAAEMGPSVSDTRATIDLVEFSIVALIEDDLVSCVNPRGARWLVGNFGIGGMDYNPQDNLLDEDCPEPKGNCFVYEGLMDLYLEPGADTDTAVFESRKAIRDLMNDSADLIGIGGIERIQYLAPSLDDASALEEGQNEGIPTQKNVGSANIGAIIAVAFGSLFLIFAFIAGYSYKRYREKEDNPPTLATESQITGISSDISSGSRTPPVTPVSRFPGMLPNPYGSPDPETMSAILENDSEDSASQGRGSDIIVSESGYTEEDSRENSFAQNMQSLSSDGVLGAMKLEDYNDDDLLFTLASDFATSFYEEEDEEIVFSSEEEEIIFSSDDEE